MTNVSMETHIPYNTNLLQATKFTFIVPNLPFAKYFCQTVILPGVTTSEAMIPTPFSETYRHGDKLVYDMLTITFLVDEDFRVWEESYNWLKSLTFPHKFGEYVKNNRSAPSPYYDAVLTMNTNANNSNIKMKFHYCHPISLGGIQFSTMENANVMMTADLTLRYDTFTIERGN